MYRFLQIFDRPVYHIRALAEQSQTLWEELWAYFRDRYFTLDIEGRYEHLDLGSGRIACPRIKQKRSANSATIAAPPSAAA